MSGIPKKRAAEDFLYPTKYPKESQSDSEDDDDEESNRKYEILKEGDIEGQEDTGITREGDVEITPFNMKEELEEGHFDTDGNYHWNKETLVRDNWMENIDWVKVKERDEKVNSEESDSEEEPFDQISLYKEMTQIMKDKETVAAALRRLGGSQSLSASQRLKMKKAGLTVGTNAENKESVTKLTELADTILTRTGNMDIYQETREFIIEKIAKAEKKKAKTDINASADDLDMYADDFDVKEKQKLVSTQSENADDKNQDDQANSESEIKWELKRKLNEDTIEGPYSTNQMNQWMHENHFDGHVWVRKCGTSGEFYSTKRVDFELYM